MKEIIMIIALCCLCATVGAVAFKQEKQVMVDKITVTHGDKKEKEIPVAVTLTKYQLAKMLDILEDGNGYGRPADPQDTFTFTSVAKGNQYSEEYNISSTHLAKKPIK
tara:strand:- start:98 stop:421 length:324 start_codon:yes stop_codon:yes gene_type:complete